MGIYLGGSSGPTSPRKGLFGDDARHSTKRYPRAAHQEDLPVRIYYSSPDVHVQQASGVHIVFSKFIWWACHSFATSLFALVGVS